MSPCLSYSILSTTKKWLDDLLRLYDFSFSITGVACYLFFFEKYYPCACLILLWTKSIYSLFLDASLHIYLLCTIRLRIGNQLIKLCVNVGNLIEDPLNWKIANCTLTHYVSVVSMCFFILSI